MNSNFLFSGLRRNEASRNLRISGQTKFYAEVYICVYAKCVYKSRNVVINVFQNYVFQNNEGVPKYISHIHVDTWVIRVVEIVGFT